MSNKALYIVKPFMMIINGVPVATKLNGVEKHLKDNKLRSFSLDSQQPVEDIMEAMTKDMISLKDTGALELVSKYFTLPKETVDIIFPYIAFLKFVFTGTFINRNNVNVEWEQVLVDDVKLLCEELELVCQGVNIPNPFNMKSSNYTYIKTYYDEFARQLREKYDFLIALYPSLLLLCPEFETIMFSSWPVECPVKDVKKEVTWKNDHEVIMPNTTSAVSNLRRYINELDSDSDDEKDIASKYSAHSSISDSDDSDDDSLSEYFKE